jgi:two-component system, NtrC family, response regulator AtoC
MATLCAYSWPGNVRELKNDMDYLAATVETTIAEPWHLPAKFGPKRDESDDFVQPSPASRAFRPIEEELRELERQRMGEALEATGGVQTRAADLIAMPRRTFFSKMKQYGLSPKSER